MLYLQRNGVKYKEIYSNTEKNKLFLGIDDLELENMLKCLCASVKQHKKDEYVFCFGDNISSVGLVLSGSVHIVKEDYWGYKTILSEISN